MSQLGETRQQKVTGGIIDDLAKFFREKGFKYIEYGEDFIKTEGFDLEIKVTVK